MLRLFIFGNGRLCLDAIKIIKQRKGVAVVGICLNEKKRQNLHELILAELPEQAVAIEYQPKDSLKDRIPEAELGLSVGFGHIISEDVLRSFPNGIVNLHTSYLPYNRGSATNVFSIINKYPVGVSLHFLDAGVDSGPIIARETVPLLSVDTGESLYKRLGDHGLALLDKFLDQIIVGGVETIANNWRDFPANTVKEMYELDELHLDKDYRLGPLIDILRARTFGDYQGAYFTDSNGKRVFVRVSLSYE